MFHTIIIIKLILFGIFTYTLQDIKADELKRMILDTEEDMATEIVNMKQMLAEQHALILNLTDEVKTLKVNQASSKESTYIRWGRKDCPGNGSILVYSGYMAGTYKNPPPGPNDFTGGAGANFLCLTDSPTWDHYTDITENDIQLTGVEYEFTAHMGVLTDFLGSNVHDGEVPCSACHVSRGTNLMIPGRTECYPGWTKEYSGYLISGYAGYADSTDIVCLDRRPETVAMSGLDDNENLIYFVEAHCGKGLECPPYVNGREFACVVCSK